MAFYKKGDFHAALDRFSRAHAIVRLTTTGLWRGRCLVKLRRLVEASEQLLAVSRMEVAADARELFHQAKTDAAREHQALQARIAHLKLIRPVQNAGPRGRVAALQVKLDGKLVPAALLGVDQPIDPGQHHVEARRDQSLFSKPFSIDEGASMTLKIEFAAKKLPVPTPLPAEPRSSWQPTLGWVSVALGGAALVGGAITGGARASCPRRAGGGLPQLQLPTGPTRRGGFFRVVAHDLDRCFGGRQPFAGGGHHAAGNLETGCCKRRRERAARWAIYQGCGAGVVGPVLLTN